MASEIPNGHLIPVRDLSLMGQNVCIAIFKQDFGCSISRASLVKLVGLLCYVHFSSCPPEICNTRILANDP